MKNKNNLFVSGISGLLVMILIVLVRFVDVRPIGPEGTSIGLSRLNGFFFRLSGVNILWYHITDWLGVAAILVAFLFAMAGFVQLIKRRSILKVDREILALGGLYIVVIGLYVLFEMVIVNYRPIIMPDGTHPEASFPSSHTMLVCVIMGSAIMLIGKYLKEKPLCRVLRGICAAIIGMTVIGRLIAGVHWFTDIVGGILISIFLLSLFSEVLKRTRRNTIEGK
jgi:undecaprenyl-diphosphatase